MNGEEKEKSAMDTPLADWLKSFGSFWEEAMKGAQPSATDSSASGRDAPNRYLESLETLLKRWQSTASTLNDPQMAEAVLRGANTLPEIFMTLSKAGFETSTRLQQQALEKVGKIGQKTEAYNFENIDQDLFRAWKEIYEEEFRQYFKIPQLGLTRYYQERFNRFVDQWNLFQATLSEFLFLLYLPMEKSCKVFQDELERMNREGELPEKAKEYYNTWLKILEGHYMTLFKSPEYLLALGETVNRLEAFALAKNQFLQDVLQALPIPTNKELDDLYKELYILKKRVKALEREQGGGKRPRQGGPG